MPRYDTVPRIEAEPLDDEVTRELARMTVRPPQRLAELVVARSTRVQGPAGPCYVAFGASGISYIELAAAIGDDPQEFTDRFRARFGRPILALERPPAAIIRAFGGPRRSTVRIDLAICSPFERAVLEKTEEIPPGEIRPYGWVAAEIGRPKAMRAVGSALGRNPVPFLVPCHRVVRNDGRIGNYGFGPPVKAALLRAEGIELDEHDQRPLGPRFVGSATTRIVCYPSCRDARRIKAANRVEFTALREAITTGYRPCKNCRPVGAGVR